MSTLVHVPASRHGCLPSPLHPFHPESSRRKQEDWSSTEERDIAFCNTGFNTVAQANKVLRDARERIAERQAWWRDAPELLLTRYRAYVRGLLRCEDHRATYYVIKDGEDGAVQQVFVKGDIPSHDEQ